MAWTTRHRDDVAVHGITSNAWVWDPVAHHLAGGAEIIALDLRGRGRSFGTPGPFGIRQHADDVAAVIAQLGSPALVIGHSMGAFVALMAAERHPDAVSTVVLVDGGTPLPRPTGPDAVLDTTLDGGFRVGVSEAAVRQDGRELLADDEIRALLDRRAEQTTIVRAELGMFGEPPGFIPPEERNRYPQHRWVEGAGLNHYTVMNSSNGAALVADAVRQNLMP